MASTSRAGGDKADLSMVMGIMILRRVPVSSIPVKGGTRISLTDTKMIMNRATDRDVQRDTATGRETASNPVMETSQAIAGEADKEKSKNSRVAAANTDIVRGMVKVLTRTGMEIQAGGQTLKKINISGLRYQVHGQWLVVRK